MHFIGNLTKKVYRQKNIWHGDTYELLDVAYTKTPKADNFIDKNYTGVWRYKWFLPLVEPNNLITVKEGNTPLLTYKSSLKNVLIKQEQLFISGSYKDRGATVLISMLKQLGIKHAVQDSSGNAGASIAMYCAMAKVNCDIYIPKNTSIAKQAQIKAYGASIITVNGNRDLTAQTAFNSALKSYYASHCYNPLFFEGTKTFLFEIFEQLNFNMPDAIVLPAGNGTLLIGCFIGIKQLINAGITNKVPKLIAIQSANCSPLHNLISNQINNFTATIAEGIAVEKPVRINQMAEAVTFTNGMVITVNEEEIVKSWKNLALAGYYVEPTSAATIAGLDKYIDGFVTTETVVSLFSGNGLKATDKWLKYLKLI